MTQGSTSGFDLDRFVKAQEGVYDSALAEIRAGRKQSHWMWFVFPQYAGLGSSPTSQHFAIKSRAEAEAYLAHPVLGARLNTCAEAALAVMDRSADEVFGPVDAMKLRSSATLFAAVSQHDSVFHRILDRYFRGRADERTNDLLNS